MATHSSILAWRIPWTEEPDRLWLVHRVTKSWTRLKRLRPKAQTGVPGLEEQLWVNQVGSQCPREPGECQTHCRDPCVTPGIIMNALVLKTGCPVCQLA